MLEIREFMLTFQLSIIKDIKEHLQVCVGIRLEMPHFGKWCRGQY